MDNRPIGVFDSGLGGLTAVRELLLVMPEADIIYFGDTARVPYGTRSESKIISYTKQDINFLLSFDIRAILIACGTASSVALPHIKKDYALPITGVVEPSADRAVSLSKYSRIGVIGTQSTISSGAFSKRIKTLSPDAQVFEIACPLFVPLVENGRFSRFDEAVRLIALEYLAPLKKAQIDTLILGCTHYGLLRDLISDIMGSDVTLIDSGAEAARYVLSLLHEDLGKNGAKKSGEIQYFVSDIPESFSNYATIFLGHEIGGNVRRIDIDKY